MLGSFDFSVNDMFTPVSFDFGVADLLPSSFAQPQYQSLQSLMTNPNTPQTEGLLPTRRNPSVTPPAELEAIIQAAAKEHGIDPGLISAVIKQESNFRPGLTSSAGAQGYMQLMPGTAKELGVTDVWDAGQNINAGAKYLRQMLDRFGWDYRKALAAYNAGPGNVQKYGGIPPFKETQNYVNKVLGYWGYI